MRFASLGSGSEGNGLVVEAGGTRVLVDCGFGVRDAAARLARLGLAPDDLDAILVTHEHADHIGGVPAFAAKHGIPVWATFGTLAVVAERFEGMTQVYGFDSHERVRDRRARDQPDSRCRTTRASPSQYVIGDGARRVGVLTDLGRVDAARRGLPVRLRRAGARVQPRPRRCWRTAATRGRSRQRIASRLGHLDNEAAAALLARLDTSRLVHIIAAHLSQQNNTRELARAALAGALGCAPDWIGIAEQDDGFDWRDL